MARFGTLNQKIPSCGREKSQGKKRTPAIAIYLRCKDCAGTPQSVTVCPFDGKEDEPCPLYRFRRRLHGQGRIRGSRCKAIRAYCLFCANGGYKEIRECQNDECPLYPYRFGKREKK